MKIISSIFLVFILLACSDGSKEADSFTGLNHSKKNSLVEIVNSPLKIKVSINNKDNKDNKDNKAYKLVFNIYNLTDETIKIFRSELTLSNIKFIIRNKDNNIILPKVFLSRHYPAKLDSIKSHAYIQKRVDLSLIYPELINILKRNELYLEWASSVSIYHGKEYHLSGSIVLKKL